MSSFEELLKQPLPSKLAKESADVKENEDFDISDADIDDMDDTAAAVEDVDDDVAAVDDAEDEGDTFNPDELSDDELAALDAELGGDALDAIAGADEIDSIELTPEEELEADDRMMTNASALLVKSELNAEEKAELFSNESELKTLINEGFLTESLAAEIMIEEGLVEEAKYNSKMIVRLNKEAKMKQLIALGVNISAMAKNDADWRKLKKVMKMRAILRARLYKKYYNEGRKRAMIYMKRLNKSNSKVLNAIGSKLNANK